MKLEVKIAVQYAFAVVMVALSTGLRQWLVGSFGPMPLFVTWYPAVLMVAITAGGGPGIVTTILSALAADYWFIEPSGQFSILGANDAAAMIIFTGTGIFLSILAERLRRARWAEAVSVTQERELALLNMGNLATLDLDHRIVHWSEGNRRLYGFEAQEAQDQLTYELLRTHFAQPLEQIHSELLGNGHWEGEVTRRGKDGTQLSLALLWALRRDEHGKPLAILEVSTDITRQKIAEESLRQQSEELAQQNEELTQQSEELSQQNEELQTQSEEIQALNAELGHREKMLRTLLDSARLPIDEREVMGKICRAAMEMIGQPATGTVVCEQYGDELRILAHAGFDGADVPGSWEAKGSFVEMVIQRNRTASLEDTSLRPDLNILNVPGHRRFAAVLSSPLRVQGKRIGAVSVYSNKTQQWTVEQFRLIEWLAAQCSNALESIRLAAEVLQGQKHNEFLASILEASSQAFGVGYPDGRLGLINKAFEQLTGYSGEELRSIDWARTLTPPEWMEIERRKLEELHRTGLPVRYEKEYIRKDGARVPIELLAHLVKDAEGKPLYYYSFLTDITERKRAEEALRDSERLYHAIGESIDYGVWVCKPDGRNTYASESFLKLVGLTQEQCSNFGWGEVLHPDDAERTISAWKECARTGGIWDIEHRFRGVDGQWHPILARGVPVRNDHGEILYWAGINLDIRRLKQAEEALDKTVKELERSNKELEQFAYISAHDLQEPLRQVRAFVQMLRDRHADKLNGKAAQYFQFVYDGASRMSDLVQGLLNYSRVGAREKKREPISCQTALDTALANLQVSIVESRARIAHDELPTVLAEPTQLTQLFQNLIGNAIKFRREGVTPEIHIGAEKISGVRIQGSGVSGQETGSWKLEAAGPADMAETGVKRQPVAAHPSDTRHLNPDTWLFSIRDNGIGIDPEYHEKVFMIFQRLHTREEYPGTGIGLAICKKIVEQHGGKIWIESKVGEGSTFHFTLLERKT